MLKILAALLLCTLSTTVFGVQIPDLYQGQAAATGELTQAQGQALGQVLIKLTGKPQVLSQPPVAAALAKPADYLRRYAYQGSGEEKRILAEFEPTKVNGLLSKTGLPILGAARPQIAIWLVIDDSQRRMVSDQSADDWGRELRASAASLALPVVLPIMDLDDSAAVAVTDVLGRFAEPVVAASQRYGAELVLMGQLTAKDEVWTLNWGLYGNQAGQTSELVAGSQSGNQQAVSEQLSQALAAALVERYGARVAGEKGSLLLQIEGLTRMDDISAVQGLLRGMASVAEVELAELDMDSITFSLSIYGQPDELVRLLSLERRLARLDEQPGTLHYRWQSQ